MSIYFVHKVCHLVDKDPSFRQRVLDDPSGAISGLRLTDEERTALLKGDVARLHALGAHGFALGRMPRHGVFGLNQEKYIARMKRGEPA